MEELIGITNKKIKKWLDDYFRMFANPLQAWQKSFKSNRKAYDYVLFQSKFFLIFLIIWIPLDINSAIRILFADILNTAIYTLPLLLVFHFYITRNDKDKKWNNLFRLFVIIKFQFLPVIIVVYYILRFLKLEMLIDVVYPILLALVACFISAGVFLSYKGKRKKIKLILMNTLALILWLSVVALAMQLIPMGISSGTTNLFDKYIEKVSTITPISEIEYFDIENDFGLIDDKALLVLEPKGDSLFQFKRAQFLNNELMMEVVRHEMLELSTSIKALDSVNKVYEHARDLVVQEKMKDFVPLNTSKIDSAWQSNSKAYYATIEQIKIKKRNTSFSISKEYFGALQQHLEYNDSLFQTNIYGDKNGFFEENFDFIVNPNDSLSLVVYSIQVKHLSPYRNNLMDILGNVNKASWMWRIISILVFFGLIIIFVVKPYKNL